MTYRSKCIGKRRRDEGVTERWLRRRTRGRGVHTLCWWEGIVCGSGRSRLKSARVRKRSGYKPSKERQKRVAQRALVVQYRLVYERTSRVLWEHLARPRRRA